MARQDEREHIRSRLGGHLADSDRADAAAGSRWSERGDPGDGGIRTPRWLEDEPEPPTWRDRLIPERFRHARLDPGRRGAAAMAGIGLIAALVTAIVVWWDRPAAQPVPPLPAAAPIALSADDPAAAPPPDSTVTGAEPAEPAEPTELVVSVVGLVQRAGLVRLAPGARVADAIGAAGGPLAGADLTGINLAQRLADGDQVRVGAAGDGPPPTGSATVSGGGDRPAAPGDTGPAAGAPVDLNTATEADLDALPGVGPVTAQAIIVWRETNGRFTDVEQLAEVDGIGPARLARLRALVRV